MHLTKPEIDGGKHSESVVNLIKQHILIKYLTSKIDSLITI